MSCGFLVNVLFVFKFVGRFLVVLFVFFFCFVSFSSAVLRFFVLSFFRATCVFPFLASVSFSRLGRLFVVCFLFIGRVLSRVFSPPRFGRVFSFFFPPAAAGRSVKVQATARPMMLCTAALMELKAETRIRPDRGFVPFRAFASLRFGVVFFCYMFFKGLTRFDECRLFLILLKYHLD